MKRGVVGKLVIFLAVGLLAMALYLWITLSPLRDIVEPVLTIGCPKDQLIRYECPCDGVRIKSGYCCPSGPSEKPCYCAEESINKCSDYKTEDRCTKDLCGIGCQKRWSSGACS